MDVLESTKVANKEEIRRLRDGNKEFRQKLVALQKVCRSTSYSVRMKNLYGTATMLI